MSALGQKQTFAVQNGMSALPSKADICGAVAHVRFVPIANVALLFFAVAQSRDPFVDQANRIEAVVGRIKCPNSRLVQAVHS